MVGNYKYKKRISFTYSKLTFMFSLMLKKKRRKERNVIYIFLSFKHNKKDKIEDFYCLRLPGFSDQSY